MNIFTSTRVRPLSSARYFAFFVFLLLFCTHLPFDLCAEGSKDFVNYPGKRLFLDTRDNQQMKVYAQAGEFINVGASHLGLSGGFISVYRPDGTLEITFDNSADDGTAVIFNSTQEQNGPIGEGVGYSPGVIAVGPGGEGIWTVVFDFPGQDDTAFYQNLENDEPWTRGADQPTAPRVVLAWDITVSTGAAGNAGGNLLTGRVYTNKYVSEILENGNETSPVFFILSKDGFRYRVDFNNIDPFRFTVGSNSFGITEGTQMPVYRSVEAGDYTVSRFPETWEPDELYLYQFMAEDFESLINNKVFFNLPADDLPAEAPVTDIFAPVPNTHTTWLNSTPTFNPTVSFSNFNFVGFDEDGIQCDPNTAQTGIGGFAVFDINLGGSAILSLDLNNDGDFTDDTDRRIFEFVEAGTDSIFWDGNDGLGNPLPVDEGFTINYNINVRGGEIHIPVIDVENNPGGVTFNLIDESGTPVPTEFYYDNRAIGGEVSGGGTGEPQPTMTPFTYEDDFGDNIIFDYWSYINFTGSGSGSFTVTVSDDCVCQQETSPSITLTASQETFCDGQGEVILQAVNSQVGQETLIYTYFDANGEIGRDTVSGTETSFLNLGTASAELAGEYSVIAVNERECESQTAAVVNFAFVPTITQIEINNLSAEIDTAYCAGADATVIAEISNAGSAYTFSLTDADGNLFLLENAETQGDSLLFTLPGVEVTTTFTLGLVNEEGCTVNESFTVNIADQPAVESFIQSIPVNLCEGDSIVLSAVTENAANYTLLLPDNTEISDTVAADGTVTYVINEPSEETTGTYSLITATADGCVSDTATVTVEALPSEIQLYNFMGAGAYCEGAEITLTVFNTVENVGLITYTVTGQGIGFSETVTDTDTVSVTIEDFTADQAGEYMLTIDGPCQSDTTMFMLTLLEEVEYTSFTGAGTYCAGDDLELNAETNLPASAVVTYTWTGPDGFEFTDTAPGDGSFSATLPAIGTAAAGTYVLTLDIPNFDCGNEPLSFDVSVNEVPVIENVTGGGTYCQLTPVEFSAINTNTNLETVTYTWTAPDGFTFTETVNAVAPLTFTTTELNDNWDGVWTLLVSSPAGCEADTVFVDVNLEPAIVIFELEGGGTYCAGETIEMSAYNGNPNVDVVIWSWENSNGIFASGVVDGTEPFSASIPDASVQDTGTYVLLMSSENACPIGVGTFEVEIQNAPIASEIEGGGLVCAGEDVTLLASNTAEFTGIINYTWTGPNGFMQTGVVDENEQIVTTLSNLTEADAGTYTLTMNTSEECGETSVSTEITLAEATIASDFAVSTNWACDGGEVVLSANANVADGMYEFFYTSGNGNTVSLGSSDSPTLTISPFDFANEGEYFVEISGNCGAFIVSDTETIMVISGVDAFEDNAATQQETLVTIPVMDNDLMGNNSDFTYTIVTAPQNGTAEFNAEAAIDYTPDAEFTGVDSLVYQICSDLCPDICDQAIVYITVSGEDCFIPNYFSPNGDDSNDVFFIDCLETTYPDNNITIYNRWGDEVYQAEPYPNDWDGKRDGTDLPAGTYFYLLNLTPDGSNCQQGYITIVK